MASGPRAYNILRGYINREWDRLSNLDVFKAEQELDAASSVPAQPPSVPTEDQGVRARSVLGVSSQADYTEIKAAYENLRKRSDPARFPEGSMERAQALQIQKRVEWAFKELGKGADSTEQRFRSLEIE